MGVQPFYDKRPHQLSWAGSQAARENIINVAPSCLIFVSLYIVDICGRVLRNTPLRAAGWRPIVYTVVGTL